MGVPSWAVKGAKVVCVDALWSSNPPTAPLVQNATYTIERAFCVDRGIGYECWAYLAEVANPIAPDWGFHLDRFRPVHSVETDIEVHFKALLDVPNQVEA